jgi:hypothetical protein
MLSKRVGDFKVTKLFTVLILLVSFAARADGFGPSVWEQNKYGSLQNIDAKIIDVVPLENQVWITYRRMPADKNSPETMKLCDEDGSDNNNFRSEDMRAAFFREHSAGFNAAKVSQKPVQLVYKGPWSPCLLTVKSPVGV